jgi:hypothetical protein
VYWSKNRRCPFRPEISSSIRPTRRGHDMGVMTERLIPGHTYRVERVDDGKYVVVEGPRLPSGGLFGRTSSPLQTTNVLGRTRSATGGDENLTETRWGGGVHLIGCPRRWLKSNGGGSQLQGL